MSEGRGSFRRPRAPISPTMFSRRACTTQLLSSPESVHLFARRTLNNRQRRIALCHMQPHTVTPRANVTRTSGDVTCHKSQKRLGLAAPSALRPSISELGRGLPEQPGARVAPAGFLRAGRCRIGEGGKARLLSGCGRGSDAIYVRLYCAAS
jgi:hypothetical protein